MGKEKRVSGRVGRSGFAGRLDTDATGTVK
jgi:hypothetical protein